MKKTRKSTFLSAFFLFMILTACVQSTALSEFRLWLEPTLKPLADALSDQLADLVHFGQPDPTPTLTLMPRSELAVEETLIPSQIPTDAVKKPITPTPSEDPVGRIIYTCQVDKNPSHDQICMVNADGTGRQQLTDDLEFQHFYPSWAPDNRSFIYVASRTGEFKIYENDFTGNEKLVGDISGNLYAPMISPDGEKIVFTRHYSESEQYISVCDRDGADVQNLTGYYDARDPVWSPDGSKILFTSLHDGTQQLYFMNADGTLKQKISELAGLRGRTDWSVDLSIATYAGEYEQHNREIVLLELGGKPKVITEGGDNLSPSFSHDGQWIVFMSYRDNFWVADGCELYVMRVDGSDIRRITDNGYCDYQPRWGQ